MSGRDTQTPPAATGLPLSHSMRLALQWMSESAEKGHDPHGVIANTMDAPYLADGQVFRAVATARALERRGLIRVVEGTDAYLV